MNLEELKNALMDLPNYAEISSIFDEIDHVEKDRKDLIYVSNKEEKFKITVEKVDDNIREISVNPFTTIIFRELRDSFEIDYAQIKKALYDGHLQLCPQEIIDYDEDEYI